LPGGGEGSRGQPFAPEPVEPGGPGEVVFLERTDRREPHLAEGLVAVRAGLVVLRWGGGVTGRARRLEIDLAHLLFGRGRVRLPVGEVDPSWLAVLAGHEPTLRGRLFRGPPDRADDRLDGDALGPVRVEKELLHQAVEVLLVLGGEGGLLLGGTPGDG